MGRGGNEIAAEQLLYGKTPFSRNGQGQSPLLETIIGPKLLADGRIDWVSSSGRSTIFNVLSERGRNLFLYRPAPKGMDQQLFAPRCHAYPEPTGVVMHEQLGDNRDMLAWQEDGGNWIVSVNTITGEQMVANSANVADPKSQLSTIRGYPGMAWIELRERGEFGLVLVEGAKHDPFVPAMAGSSYPAAVFGDPGNVKAIYNKERDEIIAAWSENQDNVAVIRIWSSISGSSVISPEAQLSPTESRDIEIREIIDRETGPAVVWSPKDSASVAVSDEEGKCNALFTGGTQPEFALLDDDRLVFAHCWGGDLIFGEVAESGSPRMISTIPDVEEAQIFGGSRARAVYRSGGSDPGIFQLEEDGSTKRIPGTADAHLLGSGQDSRGEHAAWLLDRSGGESEIRKLTVR